MIPLLLTYWKQIAIGVAILIAASFGITAVLTYRSAVIKAERLQKENEGLTTLVEAQRRQTAKLLAYQGQRDKVVTKYRDKIVTVYTQEAKRDEKGNIQDGDPVLARLNGLFGNHSGSHQATAP